MLMPMVPPPRAMTARRTKIRNRIPSRMRTAAASASRILIPAGLVRGGQGLGRVLALGGRRALGEDCHRVAGDRQEAIRDVVGDLLAIRGSHAHPTRLLELAQQWRVPSEYGKLALGGAGHDHLRLAGPH